MKFESSDVANVATAMDVDEELCEKLKLPDSSDDEEESESESKKETPKEKQERLKAFAEENLGKLEVPEKAKRSNRKVTDKQIEDFILLISDGVAIKDAATTGIKLSSAYNYRKLHVMDPNNGVPYRNKRGRKGSYYKLKDIHADFIIKHIDVHSTANLMQIKDLLCEEFPGLEISKSALHRFMKNVCTLSMKRLEKIPAKRNDPDTIENRKTTVEFRIANTDMDFEKNCVFLDEAGCNLNITRNRGWSKKGKPAKTIVPSARGISITILGAISADGVIDISLRKPTSAVSKKKRKIDGKTVQINGRVGTRSEHFLSYLNSMMDYLDRNGLHEYYIVMDNAPIHKPTTIRKQIEDRGYKCVYLPPYSPFLNPIEEFWSKVKSGYKRNPLDTTDRLTPRIMDAVTHVSLKDCRGWIKHSVSFFLRCIAKEDMLQKFKSSFSKISFFFQ